MKITMKRRAAAWVVALAMLTGLTACGVSESTSELAGSASQSAAQTVDKDPFGKYEEPITLTAVRYLQDGIEFNEGESLENNVWSREYAETLGINLEYAWTTPQSEYAQKLNVSSASDDLPDLMWVDAAQLKRMVEDDQLADLTQVYADYAAPYTNEVLHQDGGSAMESATIGGKLYGRPTFSPVTIPPMFCGSFGLLEALRWKRPKPCGTCWKSPALLPLRTRTATAKTTPTAWGSTRV